MHTQYNLILSAAVMSRCKEDENVLVLHSEFALNDKILGALYQIFDEVIVVNDKFYAPSSALDEIKHIRRCLKKVKSLKNEVFDNIFMSQERVFDLIVCARAKKINPNAACYDIEEDAYYSINPKYSSDDFVYKESRRMKRRKFLYSLLLFGYPYNWRDISYCYGMSSEYDGANLLFPDLARKEIKDKKLIEIKEVEILEGIKAIYSNKKTDLPQNTKYTLIFFDLMNRYKTPERVKEIVLKIIESSQADGRTILFKYHPRETQKFENIDGGFEIPSIIPAEKVLMDLHSTDTIVMGNATTSCIVAAKLGFKVLSICKLEFPENKKMHDVMENMGIVCVDKISNINKI